MAKLNWSTSHTQITDEIINRSSSGAAGLMHDIFYNETSSLVEIWTGAGGTGTQLTVTNDYTIGGAVTEFPANITDPTPDTPYTTVAIVNASYLSTDLYVSYYPIADYVEAEDFTQLVNGIDLPDQDISSTNKTTDLTIYEPGGSNALQDGAIVNVSWSGGDTTYYHKFSTTSGWTLKNNFANLAAGDGSSLFWMIGYGSGGLKLKLDIPNLRWVILTEGTYDQGREASGSNGYKAWEIRTDKTQRCQESMLSLASNTLTYFPVPFADNYYNVISDTRGSNSNQISSNVQTAESWSARVQDLDGSFLTSSGCYYIVDWESRD